VEARALRRECGQHGVGYIPEQGGIAEERSGACGDTARDVGEPVEGFAGREIALGVARGPFLEKGQTAGGGVEGELPVEGAQLVEDGEWDGAALEFADGGLKGAWRLFGAAENEAFAIAKLDSNCGERGVELVEQSGGGRWALEMKAGEVTDSSGLGLGVVKANADAASQDGILGLGGDTELVLGYVYA